MILAVDASVALKWFLNLSDAEPDSERALTLLSGIGDGSVQIVQPVHFVAEVTAVLAREKPEEALDDLLDLLEVDFRLMPAVAFQGICEQYFFRPQFDAAAMNHRGAEAAVAVMCSFDKLFTGANVEGPGAAAHGSAAARRRAHRGIRLPDRAARADLTSTCLIAYSGVPVRRRTS